MIMIMIPVLRNYPFAVQSKSCLKTHLFPSFSLDIEAFWDPSAAHQNAHVLDASPRHNEALWLLTLADRTGRLGGAAACAGGGSVAGNLVMTMNLGEMFEFWCSLPFCVLAQVLRRSKNQALRCRDTSANVKDSLSLLMLCAPVVIW